MLLNIIKWIIICRDIFFILMIFVYIHIIHIYRDSNFVLNYDYATFQKLRMKQMSPIYLLMVMTSLFILRDYFILLRCKRPIDLDLETERFNTRLVGMEGSL